MQWVLYIRSVSRWLEGHVYWGVLSRVGGKIATHNINHQNSSKRLLHHSLLLQGRRCHSFLQSEHLKIRKATPPKPQSFLVSFHHHLAGLVVRFHPIMYIFRHRISFCILRSASISAANVDSRLHLRSMCAMEIFPQPGSLQRMRTRRSV